MYLILTQNECEGTARPHGLYVTRQSADAAIAEWLAEYVAERPDCVAGEYALFQSLPEGNVLTCPLRLYHIRERDTGAMVDELYLYSAPPLTE